ncbi:rubrerythrin family protein [Natronomonas sp. F2-12]|jgi:hypothetical protein|uniref:Rubrerythrin family protein n=1 Tax=Natronomonas aquatica TaxID=2841590 RepID=A0A9R1D6C3_9EURY|nr:rubrerythrin family protein [Natronomonas aquatica]MCQ4332872.1 rubrerythrin family protein [Natronomonas aquatica]
MDANTFLDAVREANNTELDRLGSEKALVAETAAHLDRDHVLDAAAAAEARAAETFDRWADDEPNERVAAAFREAAESERDHCRQVTELGGTAEDPPADALHSHLRELDSTLSRVAAGLVGRPLVASRTLLQVINFFVNQGETDAAGTFRTLRGDTDGTAEDGAELVVELCEADGAFDRALESAGEAIEVAYAEYADTLEGMGVDPKPVC